MQTIQSFQQENGSRQITQQGISGNTIPGFQAPIQQSFNPKQIPKQFLHQNQF